MRHKGTLNTLGFLLAGVLAIPAFSAPRATMTNPAQPGTLNYIEGQVTAGGQALNQNSVGTELHAGEVLATQNGKAEILLTPGVFLRLDRNSAITLDSPDLAAIHLTLQQGRSLVEVDQIFKENNIAIAVDGANARIVKKGLYEFNAAAPDIRVFDGEAKVEVNGKEISVHGGNQLAVNEAGQLKTHGFDKKNAEQEDFYRWASLRSSYLAEANVKAASMYVAGGPGWYGAGWYWNPWFSAYTWIPGDGIFWNPFGWGFFAPGFVGYAPYYGFGFGYAPFYHRFGPGYHAPALANRGFAGHEFHGGFGGGVQGGGFGARGVAGGGFHGGMAGGGFHGGGGGHGR